MSVSFKLWSTNDLVGENSKEKREREKMTNDLRNINLSPGRPCVSSSIPDVKLLQIQPGFLAL